jgi:SET domain-containing protein
MLYQELYESARARIAKRKESTSTICVSKQGPVVEKKTLVPPSKLQVKKSNTNGYGVFATQNIRKGEVVEEAPFTRTELRDKEVSPKVLQVSYFLPCKCEECKTKGEFLLLSSGFVTLYNHSGSKNVECDFLPKQRLVRVTAVKDIKQGEEVFHNYGDKYNQWENIKM